jgi:hypothetical protein
MKGAIAIGLYSDVWRGEVQAFLAPFQTTRQGKRIVLYRRVDDRGSSCGGFSRGYSAKYWLKTDYRGLLISHIRILQG